MANTWPSIISTAKRSNSRAGGLRRWTVAAIVTTALFALAARPLAACPFCTAIAPTLCQLRQQAVVTALAEVEAPTANNQTTVQVHKVLEGAKLLAGKKSLNITLDLTAPPGSLLVLFGSGAGKAAVGELSWHAVSVNETSYSYFARAPSLKIPLVERLRYFGPFLENRDPLVAQDAYLEFGHAPFEDVARTAGILSPAKMREWLTNPQVPQDRKGFYGLALGLTGNAAERRASTDFLKKLILAPEDDFRAGFDGILGGYLMLSGTDGLDLIESRYLANPHAADGDVRHALTAVRFYHEYGDDIPAARLNSAIGKLLKRHEFAEAAITDLARWKDWTILNTVASLYSEPAYSQPGTRRAIVGYLLACPLPQSARLLADLRQIDPQGISSAEQILLRTTTTLPAD
jgi:hypothetical protein